MKNWFILLHSNPSSYLNENRRKKSFFFYQRSSQKDHIKSKKTLCIIGIIKEDTIFDDVIKMLMSAKIFLDILKAYMMVYIIIKFLRL